MVELVSDIAFQMVKSASGAWTEEHERQWIKEASLTCGGGDNKSTNEDVNMTGTDSNAEGSEELSSSSNSTKTPEDVMEETLKVKSHVHKAINDERRHFSCILFLNHVPEGHFVGRFNITNFRLTCTGIPFYCLVFSANNPHAGSGFAPYEADLPADSPLRFTPVAPAGVELPKLTADSQYTRCVFIAYSRQDCLRVRSKQLNSTIFEDPGLGGFITRKAQANWKIRHAIRDGKDIGVIDPTVDDYLEKFSWFEEGVKCYEDRKLVEDALALKGTDNEEWETMLKATAYNSAHIKRDHPTRYQGAKRRKAREAILALGNDAYCTQITSKGTRCKSFLAKNINGVKLCGIHYNIFVASKNGSMGFNGEDCENFPGMSRGLKRQREEESEGEDDDDEEDEEDQNEIHLSSRPTRRDSQDEDSLANGSATRASCERSADA
ncbi:hypothetical protein ONS96_001679 [Cadophora gregata f. sp. sojae]|nr:hypothetical protein ONS96_001679 [Cadophora gregata f. sp. sojae]